MTDTTEVTIEEQIAYMRQFYRGGTTDAIFASLLELQRIQKAERPEPHAEFMRVVESLARQGSGLNQWIVDHIDALSAYADRMAAERDMWKAAHTMMKTETAEAWGARDVERDRAESAEAKLARVKKGLLDVRSALHAANETPAIADTLWMECGTETVFDAIDELLRQVEEGK